MKVKVTKLHSVSTRGESGLAANMGELSKYIRSKQPQGLSGQNSLTWIKAFIL